MRELATRHRSTSHVVGNECSALSFYRSAVARRRTPIGATHAVRRLNSSPETVHILHRARAQCGGISADRWRAHASVRQRQGLFVTAHADGPRAEAAAAEKRTTDRRFGSGRKYLMSPWTRACRWSAGEGATHAHECAEGEGDGSN
jgi:hypothetical protein